MCVYIEGYNALYMRFVCVYRGLCVYIYKALYMLADILSYALYIGLYMLADAGRGAQGQ